MSTANNTRDPSRDASPSAGTTTPRRKEKKKVGFHQHGSNRPTSIVVDDGVTQQQLMSMPSMSQTDGPDSFTTPRPSPPNEDLRPPPISKPPMTPTGAPDATELRRALSRILTTQDEGSRGRQVAQAASPAAGPSDVFRSPQKPPRPVLRRDTSYDHQEERIKADIAEMITGEREQRSGQAARERAHNLAVTVENYASPYESRRPSFDSDDDLEAGGRSASSTGVAASNHRADNHIRSRPRKNSHLTAEYLVRRHTRRDHKNRSGPAGVDPDHTDGYFDYRPSGARSGAATPEPIKEAADEYVPKPTRYHGGILGSLLRLYNNSTGTGSGTNSGRSTPGMTTPNVSPPTSAPASATVSPRPSRPSSGIWSGLYGAGSPVVGSAPELKTHQRNNSNSSLAIGELMKASSAAFMAPGSSTSLSGVAERIKQEGKKRKTSMFGGDTPKSKSHKKSKQAKAEEELRIKNHISAIIFRHKYLVKLCRALMMYGAPTHRLEEYMTMSSRILEIESQFLYLPNVMIISFDDSTTHTTEVKILRVRHGINLGKLRDVHIIYKEVLHDQLSVEDATKRLDDVLQRDLKFSVWVRVPVCGLASATVAPFAFGGRFIDIPIAFVLGCVLGVMQLILAPRNPMYASVFELSASIVISFLARMFGSIHGGSIFCFSALAQSGIALILPGYMVLCSALELQSQNLVCGSVRMVYALIYTLCIGYGLTIGTAVYGVIDREGATSETSCRGGMDKSWYSLFVFAFTLCLCIINNAKWKQMPVMLAIAMAGYYANSYSSSFFRNSQVSNTLGALAVGILANLYSRLGRHVHNRWMDFLDWWDVRVRPRFSSSSRRRNGWFARNKAHGYQHQNGGSDGDGTTAPGSVADMYSSVPMSPTLKVTSSSDDDEVKPTPADEKKTEAGVEDDKPTVRPRKTGYGLAAAAMLPAIFVQVPGGLAAGGSLLAGLTTANEITRSNSTITSVVNGTLVNITAPATGTLGLNGNSLNTTPFSVLFNVIQVAIGIAVGLFLSALIVYPFGKRRSGLLSL